MSWYIFIFNIRLIEKENKDFCSHPNVNSFANLIEEFIENLNEVHTSLEEVRVK